MHASGWTYVQMAVYGAAVTPVAEMALQRLRGAMFGAVRTTCHLVTTAAMVFEQCATEGPELDQEVVVAAQRLQTLRRAWVLLPELRPLLCEAGKAYADGGHPAAMEESGEIAPALPPGWKTRKGWKKGLPCFGPVGLALQSARAYALTLSFSDEEGVTVRQKRRGGAEMLHRAPTGCAPPHIEDDGQGTYARSAGCA